MADPPRDDEVEALKLTYERMVHERDRLRDARAFFARQLGPLPAFAGISVALVGSFSEQIERNHWIWIALGGLGAMIVVSALYSRMPPYRQLRAEEARRAEEPGTRVDDTLTPKEWYVAEIRLERAIYPRLEEQLQRERRGLFAAQFLFLVVIGCLLAARL